jgi:YesN/AraC family two-component response regulator
MFSWNYKKLEQSTLSEIEKQMECRCLYDIEQFVAIRNTSANKKEIVEQIYLLIDDKIYDPELSVALIADEIHLSINYLRNIFKDNTGGSLSNYITKKRLDVIIELLLNSEMSLSEISDKLGFSNRNYFFTFFKKHKGMTPNEFRMLHQKHLDK